MRLPSLGKTYRDQAYTYSCCFTSLS